MKKHVIIIAGMHRSGTSMVTRLLNLHGAYIPLEAEYSDKYNERGYWESFRLQRLNDEILYLGGSCWFDIREFQPSQIPPDRFAIITQKLEEFVQELLSVEERVIVLKDPRICRIFPIWHEALVGQGAKVSAIIPFRNPLEVAASIRNRDGFEVSYSLSLWLQNVLAAEHATRKVNRVFLAYREALDSWPSCFDRISSRLKLSSLRTCEEINDQIETYLSKQLAHWTFDEDDIKDLEGINGSSYRAYQLLEALSRRDSAQTRGKLDALRNASSQESSVAVEMGEWNKRIDGLLVTHAQSEWFNKEILRLQEVSEQLLQHNQDQLEKYQAQVAELTSKLEQKVQETSGLAEQVSGLNRDLQSANNACSELTKRLEELEQDFHAYKSDVGLELAQAENSITSLTLELRVKNSAYDGLQAKHERLVSDHEVLDIQNRSQQQNLSDLQGRVENLTRDYSAVVTSISWRVTWPFRALVKYLLLAPAARLKSVLFTTSVFLRRIANGKFRQEEPHPLVKQELASRNCVPITQIPPPDKLPIQLIAFYLPQFHPIPENDEWWGKDFTEWCNVKPAKALFSGHYQPKVPGELGYYDLRDPKIQARQVELAKLYGVGGFCFYFYWFDGKRLLETPIGQYLENSDLDLPFCLCWANENWSRKWDGLEGKVLIEQNHSEADDIAFIAYIEKYFRDERYIRVDGKPLLVVYRPSLLPDGIETARRWRDWCRAHGVGEIFLAYTQSFEAVDPKLYGFDAAIEFPPNITGPEIVTGELDTLDPGFRGFVYNWESVSRRSNSYSVPDYPLFRAVNPGWDNTPRRDKDGTVFVGSTPAQYENWLRNAGQDTLKRFESPSQRLVFANAWNEWAEGAYLEPDEAHGYAYLDATRNALESISNPDDFSESGKFPPPPKIALVVHDALPHGAQFLTLHLVQVLSRDFHFQVSLVVLDDGPLLGEFEKWAAVYKLSGVSPTGPEAISVAKELANEGVASAIANSTVSGLFLGTLSDAGIRCISLVHELPEIIQSYNLQAHAKVIAERADSVVFAVPQVAKSFRQFTSIAEEKIIIRPQGLYKRNPLRQEKDAARKELRTRLKLTEDAKVVLGVGYLDHRKGVDLFVNAGLRLLESNRDVYFVWVGYWEAEMQAQISGLLASSDFADHFIFPGHQEDTHIYYAGSDVFALTSREDPFPSTVMEALEVGVPVVAFEQAGGAETLLRRDCGVLVAFEDTTSFAEALGSLLRNEDLATSLGETGAQIVQNEFSFRHYVFDLLDLAGFPQKRVSAVVPNYNYARYLEQRLNSIINQDFPIFELIVIDDASTDDSVEVAEGILQSAVPDSRLVVNPENSGSVFRQWKSAVNLARGDFVWICEADDFAESGFLSRVVRAFEDPEVVLSFCQSRQIDEAGNVLGTDYLEYTNDVCNTHWAQDFVADGSSELTKTMAIKNCIPNVSAVVFRKSAIEKTLERSWDTLLKLKIAGDWFIYTDILRQGKIAFTSASLNAHRRHANSVTIDTANNESHMSEILFMQEHIAAGFNISEATRVKAKAFAAHARSHLGLVDKPSSQVLEIGDRSEVKRSEAKARAIAFYLPQFHPISENDEWWGRGFTEWTNVSKAQPLFPGHYQPHVPTDLGFYDLRLAESRKEQARLAQENGIEGFAYWHYWFKGKQLLERPFNEVLGSGEPDFPICLAWANETWSRRWLGEDKDILIAQTYSHEDDQNHIRWLMQAFSDSRYIRVNGQPLFLVYRPSDLPDPQRTTDTFRNACIKHGIPEPYLIGINGHDVNLDATGLGFDGTLHFTPQLGILPDAFLDGPLASRRARNQQFGVKNDVVKIFDYAESIRTMLELRHTLSHETIPSLFVGWDNTPRRKEDAIVMVGNKPEIFGAALRKLVEEMQDRPHQERLIFLNAWNEWAEGNHLEPDIENGHGFLEATRNVLLPSCCDKQVTMLGR